MKLDRTINQPTDRPTEGLYVLCTHRPVQTVNACKQIIFLGQKMAYAESE